MWHNSVAYYGSTYLSAVLAELALVIAVNIDLADAAVGRVDFLIDPRLRPH